MAFTFFFSSRRRHTRSTRDWSSDVCSSDLRTDGEARPAAEHDPLGVEEVDQTGDARTEQVGGLVEQPRGHLRPVGGGDECLDLGDLVVAGHGPAAAGPPVPVDDAFRSEEHTSELQSRVDLVCRLLLEKKNWYVAFLCMITSKVMPDPFASPSHM